ncbi:MAG: HD domain-containing protein [Halobacteriota archaeon]
MVTIKDSVHGHIELAGVGADLLDTPPVQRLRHIRQLGTVHLVYPSANHTRFEHSLGVYHLARQALDHLGIEGRTARRFEAAAMVHDVGHAPFSHNLEPLLRRATGRSHDDIRSLLVRPPLSELLARHDLDPDRVADLVRGEGPLGQLLAGELDVDRMDYLVRDAHHTGVPYGTIDPGRLLRELTFVQGTLALEEGNVQSAENLLIARALMNPTVYNHHVARISKAMLRRAVTDLLDDGDLTTALGRPLATWTAAEDVHPLRRATDTEVMHALLARESTRDLASRLLRRDLYKRAVWVERSAVPSTLFEAGDEVHRSHERAIADRLGLDPTAVLIDVPPVVTMAEARSRLLVNGDLRRLGDQSPLVGALEENHRAQWRMGVYAPAEWTDAVASAAIDRLGLDVDGPAVSPRSRGLHRSLGEFGTE